MSRVNDQVASRKRRKRILKDAKGYRGGRSKLIRSAMEAVDKAGCYAYRDRRNKKRVIRALWIARINAAARMNGITYSRFMEGVIKSGVQLDRKTLSELAINDPAAFTKVATLAKETLAA